VVFRKPASLREETVPAPVETQLAAVDGSWTLSFPPNLGAPGKVTIDRLDSWGNNADAGVKYFSGTGTYSKTLDVPAEWLRAGKRIKLDLGDVRELAEVLVNGKSLGIVWHAPFTVDVTGALKPGANSLEVRVTNLWVNRLIGDQQPGVTSKYTFTAMPTYKPDAPLRPSGLLGPVLLNSVDLTSNAPTPAPHTP
jgi:hypothetical protein